MLLPEHREEVGGAEVGGYYSQGRLVGLKEDLARGQEIDRG
jgi:hypothetical protein